MVELSIDYSLDAARYFVAHAPIGMCLLDFEGRVLAISPPLLAWSSGPTPSDDILDKPVGQTAPNAAELLSEVQEQLRRGVKVVEQETSLTSLDGRAIHARSQSSYWRDKTGEPVAVLCVIQDIAAEVEARAAQIQSAAQLRAVVENIPSQISVMDLESGRISLMNNKMTAGLATYSGSCEGALRDEVLSPTLNAGLEQMIVEAEAAGGRAEVETTMDDGVAAGATYRMKFVVYKDPQGRRQLLWTADDVTELRKSAEALKCAAQAADAANRAKSEFLATMSHEIRTPLNGVLGIAGALGNTTLSPAQQEMVSLIETSGKTLETLLSDILDLAKIEAGKMEIKPEAFDLAMSINACAALFDAAAKAKGLALEVEVEPEALGGFIGDAARLRQILCNLLGNAIKFTQSGRVRLAVSAEQHEADCDLRFEVRDTGIGFDAETKARLFSRFAQADGSIARRFGGTGLGLSISRSLAEAMGGGLEADAEPGKGAVFTLALRLPRVESGDGLCAEDEDAQLESLLASLEGLRVLLAEDHPINRRVVELILEPAGVNLTCVENGLEAVDAFRREVFDLILMDMQMPVMDGLSAIAEIRRIEAAAGARRTPIHVLTANAMAEHIAESREAGADGHLSKPIIAEVLLARVSEVGLSGSSDAAPAIERNIARHI